MLFNFIKKRCSEPKYPTTIPLVRQWAQNTCMVTRVNKELCLIKAIHFVKVLCREFVHGNLFSLGLPAALTPFCKCKSKRWSRTCSIRNKSLFLKPEYTYKRKSDKSLFLKPEYTYKRKSDRRYT